MYIHTLTYMYGLLIKGKRTEKKERQKHIHSKPLSFPLSTWKRLIGGRSSHVLVHVYIYAATRTYTYIHTFILSPYFIRIMLNQDAFKYVCIMLRTGGTYYTSA